MPCYPPTKANTIIIVLFIQMALEPRQPHVQEELQSFKEINKQQITTPKPINKNRVLYIIGTLKKKQRNRLKTLNVDNVKTYRITHENEIGKVMEIQIMKGMASFPHKTMRYKSYDHDIAYYNIERRTLFCVTCTTQRMNDVDRQQERTYNQATDQVVISTRGETLRGQVRIFRFATGTTDFFEQKENNNQNKKTIQNSQTKVKINSAII